MSTVAGGGSGSRLPAPVFPMKNRLVLGAISGTVLALLLGFILPSVFTDTSDWPAVEGRIVDSRTVRTHRNRRLHLTYEYQVQNRTYRGHKATLWSDPVPGYAALGSEKQWPPGQPIRVYHHPTQPERAVLDPRISTTRKVMTVLATALSGFGVLAAFVGRPRAS